jgi:SAM-dependent methyltransferase
MRRRFGVCGHNRASGSNPMHWKVKAAIQNTIALLPRSLSYAAYYRMQRMLGGLKNTNPVEHLGAGIETWQRILREGVDPGDKVFFEVGTGRAPIVPLALWLMGARRTITVDVNPYIKEEIVRESLEFIEANRPEIEDLFGTLLQRHRMDDLLQFSRNRAFSLRRFLDLCCIDYVQPGDAADTGLPSRSIDFHTSYTVLEHIPPEVLARILVEGKRIVRDDGLFVHMVDYSDHFSHSDSTISPINFLQYSDDEWARYAGNRYMYMNRLRHDDVLALFQSAGHVIVSTTPAFDEDAHEVLEAGRLRLNRQFDTKSREILSIRGSWIVSRSAPNPGSDVSRERR